MTVERSKRDTACAFEAAKNIVDGRDPTRDSSGVLVTLEHAVAAVLLITSDNDPSRAAAMLNEGLTPGIEERLARLNAHRRGRSA